MRQLVTVQTIAKLDKIEGKDRILYASFENTGWKVIVDAKMKVGEKVVFVEADSVLPVHSAFEFLRARCFKAEWNGFVVKNMKMSGLYSTGLALPLSTIHEFAPKTKLEKLVDGEELTEIFEVIKFDPEETPSKVKQVYKPKSPLVKWFWSFIYKHPRIKMFLYFFLNLFNNSEKYSWPSFVSKTDETRAQNLNYVYEKYATKMFYATEKADGSSCTYGVHNKKFFVCSRNLKLKDTPKNSKNYWWNYAKAHDVETRLKKASKALGMDLYIQGELIGPSIQGNKYNLKELDFLVFNIKDLARNEYFSWEQLVEFCFDFGFKTVPFLGEFEFNFKNIDELLAYSKGKSVLNAKQNREGVVIRSVRPMPADRGQSNMCSFKVINPDFDVA
jgi:hypothetical protein